MSRRFGFQVDDDEGIAFETFARETGRTVGTLAVVAIRQYLHRYGVGRTASTVRVPASRVGNKSQTSTAHDEREHLTGRRVPSTSVTEPAVGGDYRTGEVQGE